MFLPSILAQSHKRTYPSLEQLAKRALSGTVHNLLTADLCSCKCATRTPRGFHSGGGNWGCHAARSAHSLPLDKKILTLTEHVPNHTTSCNLTLRLRNSAPVA